MTGQTFDRRFIFAKARGLDLRLADLHRRVHRGEMLAQESRLVAL